MSSGKQEEAGTQQRWDSREHMSGVILRASAKAVQYWGVLA